MQWLNKLLGREEDAPAPKAPSYTPSADYYRSQAAPAATPPKGDAMPPFVRNMFKPGGFMNPGKPTPATTNVARAAEDFRLSQGIMPGPSNAKPYLAKWGSPSNPVQAVTAHTAPPTDAERQILSALGYGMPADTNVPSVMDTVTSNNRDLASFSYLPTQEEIDMVTKRYKDIPGYTAPKIGARKQHSVGYWGGLGMDPLSVKTADVPDPTVSVESQSSEMTWDEYNALSQDQRNAVDFNTLLIEAREQDLNHSHVEDPAKRAEYDKQVEEMFGKGRGSETYAPNTVALLKQIDFKAVGQDLDEYLSLERGFDVNELKDLDFSKVPGLKQQGEDVDYAAVRTTENMTALDAATVTKSAEAIETVMTNSNQVLANFQSAMAAGRADIFATFGGKGMTPAAPGEQIGFPFTGVTYTAGNAADDKSMFFNQAFDALTAGQTDWIYQQLDERNISPEGRQELFDYLTNRSQQETRWGRPEGMFDEAADSENKVTRLTPDKVAAELGLGG